MGLLDQGVDLAGDAALDAADGFATRFALDELAFYRTWTPTPVPLSVLIAVAGRRWSIEEAFQAGNGLTVLDEHQVRRWPSWRKLPGRDQALLVLGHLRNGDTYEQLAASFKISVATAHCSVHEAVTLHGYGEAMMDDVELFRAIACHEPEPRAELHEVPDGPGVVNWELVGHVARELAEALTLRRSQAELQRGASERSRRLRNELRANTAGLDVADLNDLLDRLLQVRVEDYDARSGWRAFDDARRALRRARTIGERYGAAVEVAQRGIGLLGYPVADDEDEGVAEVAAQDLQLVAYEALVMAPGSAHELGEQTTLGV